MHGTESANCSLSLHNFNKYQNRLRVSKGKSYEMRFQAAIK